MRQLDTCDFCGEPPEGVYEVVPAGVADGPRRLALCASCRNTLQSVVDPLLDAASGERSDPSDAASGEAASDQAGSDSPDPATRESGSEQSSDEESSGSSQSVAAGGTSAADVTEPSTDSTTPDTTASSGSSNAGSAGAESAGAGGTPAERPDGYAQVLRLLQNRDEAMPREDLRTLTTNAYDVSAREFERALEAAIEGGDVEETDAGVRTA